MDKPTASAETLLRQACYTAHDYMVSAENDINERFGEGFAKKNPSLIAAYMNAAALDYQAAVLLTGLCEISEALQEIKYRFTLKDEFAEE